MGGTSDVFVCPGPSFGADRIRASSGSALRCLTVLLAVILGPRAARAEAPGDLLELVDFEQKPFTRLEASGVAYHAGRLVVVDDTENELFLFDTAGHLVSRLYSAQLPEAQAKFEDLAYDEKDGTYFAVGSHSGWDEEDLERQSLLIEFRLRRLEEIEERSIHTLPLKEPFELLGMWKPRTMKIEGLAVDDRNDILYVGLREPVDRARIYRMGLEGLRKGEPQMELALEFDAGFAETTPYCVAGLAWDSRSGGLFITTSTEDDATHTFLGNRLWHWIPGDEPLLLLDRFDRGRKAEGLALGADRLFIVYDNDQDDTGLGSELRVIPMSDLSRRGLATP